MSGEKLFSVTKSDLDITTCRAGGPGGQNQNKRDTAVRISHKGSGAVAESREHRTQEQNKKAAFHRLVKDKKFTSWVRMKAAAVLEGFRSIEAKIDAWMRPQHLKIEYVNLRYTCDNCGRQQHSDSLPEGWWERPKWIDHGPEHLCQRCQEEID